MVAGVDYRLSGQILRFASVFLAISGAVWGLARFRTYWDRLDVRNRRVLALAGGIVAAVGLWIVLFQAPTPISADLDPSWQESIMDGIVRYRQFGRDLSFTMGPYGFLLCGHATAEAVSLKLWSDYVVKSVLIVLAVVAVWPLHITRRWLLLLCLPFFGLLYLDVVWMVLAVVFGSALMTKERLPHIKIALFVSALAVLGLAKFTLLLCGVVGVAGACVVALAHGDYRRAGVVAGIWIVSTLGLWLLIGQQLTVLPQYLRSSLEISRGYEWAMAYEGEPWARAWCVAVLAVLATVGMVAFLLYRTRIAAHSRIVGLYYCAIIFLVWKHGIIRGDDHVVGLFGALFLVGLLLPSAFHADAPLDHTDIVVPLFAVVGLWVANPALMAGAVERFETRLATNARQILSPLSLRRDWERQTDRERLRYDLPQIRETVGSAPVDFLSFNEGILLLNGLNYQPRPVFQGYSTYTTWLERQNRDFLLSAQAPEFLVVRYLTIDDRYAAQDDALLLSEVPRLYELALKEHDLLLLRRRSGASRQPQSRELISEYAPRFDQPVSIPPSGGAGLWLQVDVQPSWLGRLRAIAYKPARLAIEITDATGVTTKFRLLTQTASEGFVIAPYLANATQFEAFLRGTSSASAKSIRIVVPPRERQLWQNVTIRLFRLPELRVP